MEVGVPCARVNNFQEVFEHPQIVARGVVRRSSIRGSAP
jgi:crotonobetainyl-CoA:carnitine CoA-transferase CaiB-like acyl-CoA transferase